MRAFIIIICVMSLTSCASRQLHQLNVGLYKQGLEIMNLSINDDSKIKNLCIILSPNVLDIQPIYYGKKFPEYLYNIKELINIRTDLHTCSTKVFKVTNVDLRYYYGDYGYFANSSSYYIGHVDLSVVTQCNNKAVTLVSNQRNKIEKKERFNYEESKSLVSTVIYLAFQSALLDVQQQIEKQNC